MQRAAPAGSARSLCGWAARGLGLGDGKVFVGQLDAKLVALDQRTGKVVWSVQPEDPKVGFSITSAPLSLRKGDNLFSVSIVAIAVARGAHEDLHDVAAYILTDLVTD